MGSRISWDERLSAFYNDGKARTALRPSEIARHKENCESRRQPDGDAAKHGQPVVDLVDDKRAGAEVGLAATVLVVVTRRRDPKSP